MWTIQWTNHSEGVDIQSFGANLEVQRTRDMIGGIVNLKFTEAWHLMGRCHILIDLVGADSKTSVL